MRITLVTVTHARAAHLEAAVRNVQAQGDPDVEHVVVAGGREGPDEATRSVLERHPHLVVIAEPDAGIYDAMNKGVGVATGDVIGFLNDDDELLPGALANVRDVFSRSPHAEVVSAAAEAGRVVDGSWHRTRTIDDHRILALAVPHVAFASTLLNSRFVTRAAWQRVGGFDLAYRIAADRDLMLRWADAELSNVVLPSVVYRYLEHEGSVTFAAGRNLGQVAEDVAVLAKFAADAAVRPEVRQAARDWHARRRGELLVRSRGRLRAGPSPDPLWFPRFVLHLGRERLWRVLGRDPWSGERSTTGSSARRA